MSTLTNGPSRLGLGTVQFGLTYGVTNDIGRVPQDEVSAILDLAARNRVEMLDTAPSYGDAEAVLGRVLPRPSPVRIVTKTPMTAGLDPDGAADRVRAGLHQSLRDLNQPAVDAVLVHAVEDLLGSAGAAIWAALRVMRDQGLVRHLGVSAYTGAEIDAVLDRYAIDLIQVPFNALDQRLVTSGHLQRLADLGVEIHARSIFLQGLLVCTGPLPKICPPEVCDHLGRLRHAWEEAGLSPLAGALSVAIHQPEVSVTLVGVTRKTDLIEVLAAFDRVALFPPPFSGSRFDLSDHWIIDPRCWAARSGTDRS